MSINFFFLIYLRKHCNLSEDIQHSCVCRCMEIIKSFHSLRYAAERFLWSKRFPVPKKMNSSDM